MQFSEGERVSTQFSSLVKFLLQKKTKIGPQTIILFSISTFKLIKKLYGCSLYRSNNFLCFMYRSQSFISILIVSNLASCIYTYVWNLYILVFQRFLLFPLFEHTVKSGGFKHIIMFQYITHSISSRSSSFFTFLHFLR